MLITFTSSTSGEILMFAEVARRLFEILGKERTARGVFTKEQLPEAIEKLRRSVLAEKADVGRNKPPVKEIDENGGEPPDIGLAQRAHPFIELMERTRDEGGYLMWQTEKDF